MEVGVDANEDNHHDMVFLINITNTVTLASGGTSAFSIRAGKEKREPGRTNCKLFRRIARTRISLLAAGSLLSTPPENET